jgi:hypothetical protein
VWVSFQLGFMPNNMFFLDFEVVEPQGNFLEEH